MAFQPADNCVQLMLKYTSGTLNAQNDLFFEFAAQPDDAALTALVNAAEAQFAASVGTVMCDAWQVSEIVAVSLDDTYQGKRILKPDPPIGGSIATPPTAANVSFALKFGIGVRGRGRSGRIYLVGIPEASADQDSIDQVYADLAVSVWNAYVTALEAAAACVHVVLHRSTNGVPLPAAEPNNVTSISYSDLVIDSMKLRLPNHKKRKTPTP